MTDPTIEDRHALLKEDRKRKRPALRCVLRIEAASVGSYDDLARRFMANAETMVANMLAVMAKERAANEELFMAPTEDGTAGPWMVDIRLARCGKDDLA